MSVLLLILKILAWILLGIVALVFVAVFIPATLEIGYQNKTILVYVRYLFLRFKLYGSDAEDAMQDIAEIAGDAAETIEDAAKTAGDTAGTADSKTESIPAKENKKKAKSKKTDKHVGKRPKFDFGLIKKLLTPGTKAVWSIVKRLKVHDIAVVAIAKGNDPAEVGIAAGRTWAAIGEAMGLINSVWERVEYSEISVIPDFAGDREDDEKYGCKITAIPVIIIVTALDFLFKYLNVSKKRGSGKQQHYKEKASG